MWLCVIVCGRGETEKETGRLADRQTDSDTEKKIEIHFICCVILNSTDSHTAVGENRLALQETDYSILDRHHPAAGSMGIPLRTRT